MRNVAGARAARQEWPSGVVQQWRDGAWVDADPADLCPSGRLDVLPSTALVVDAAAGDRSLVLGDHVAAVAPGLAEAFLPGQTLVLDPGGSRQETVVLADATGRLVTPLARAHVRGEHVIAVDVPTSPPGPGGAGTPTRPLPRTGGPARQVAALGLALSLSGALAAASARRSRLPAAR